MGSGLAEKRVEEAVVDGGFDPSGDVSRARGMSLIIPSRPGGEGHVLGVGGSPARKRETCSGPSSGKIEQVTKRRCPPFFTRGQSALRSRACSRAKARMSTGRRFQGTSGCRRTMPLAVQGASSRTASKGSLSHHRSVAAASAVRISALSPRRERVSMRRARSGSISERRHAAVDELQQVRGLAAGRRTGVPKPGRRASRAGSARPTARPRLLHRDEPFGETGDGFHGHGRFEHQRFGGPTRGAPCRPRPTSRGRSPCRCGAG